MWPRVTPATSTRGASPSKAPRLHLRTTPHNSIIAGQRRARGLHHGRVLVFGRPAPAGCPVRMPDKGPGLRRMAPYSLPTGLLGRGPERRRWWTVTTAPYVALRPAGAGHPRRRWGATNSSPGWSAPCTSGAAPCSPGPPASARPRSRWPPRPAPKHAARPSCGWRPCRPTGRYRGRPRPRSWPRWRRRRPGRDSAPTGPRPPGSSTSCPVPSAPPSPCSAARRRSTRAAGTPSRSGSASPRSCAP